MLRPSAVCFGERQDIGRSRQAVRSSGCVSKMSACRRWIPQEGAGAGDDPALLAPHPEMGNWHDAAGVVERAGLEGDDVRRTRRLSAAPRSAGRAEQAACARSAVGRACRASVAAELHICSPERHDNREGRSALALASQTMAGAALIGLGQEAVVHRGNGSGRLVRRGPRPGWSSMSPCLPFPFGAVSSAAPVPAPPVNSRRRSA